MTQPLYLKDCYIKEFEAKVVRIDKSNRKLIVLDKMISEARATP